VKNLMIIGGVILTIYVVAAVSMFSLQRRLLYFPDTARHQPSEVGLSGVKEVVLDTPDGAKLIAWYAPARSGRPTLLYFHGNGGGLANRADRIRRFNAAGYGVFMPSYRGYSGGTGSPSEGAIVADAKLAYDHLIGMGLSARQIVPYGESLGSGVAVRLATERQVAALILDAPYTSLPDVGKLLYPMMPVHSLMLDRFESRTHIKSVRAPILILHGTEDEVIPIEFGEALFALAPEPKEIAVIDDAGHSDIYSFGAFATLDRFLNAHVSAASRARAD
jgi:uncharacterized protein